MNSGIWAILGLSLIVANVAAGNSRPEASTMVAPHPHNPVLLIHGIKDDARKMETMARYLRAQGWEASTLSLRPSWGQVGLDELAEQISQFVEENYTAGTKIDLVGFSMGGLVCRYYLQRLGGVERVERFVTLSTPHHGTWLAWLMANPGCRQMRPGSDFLADLNGDMAQLNRLKFTSLWTPLDLVILPPRSSEVPGACNLKTWVALHPFMVIQPKCLRAVAEALRKRTQGS